MSHQVLARKWRPTTFENMAGQTHVLKALQHALSEQRLHHAYLLTGTRGVGKTTIGRILAKCLNCETGITPTPCDTCANCQAINEGRFVDLIEVDAASRTKVEDTRDLLSNVQYAPSQGRFKIYLIDEVHMLSGHSFNALLKTLEEPPEHVKFILATTDPQRLPVTVLSRCLQFHLKHIPIDTIVDQLTTILTAENIAFEKEALFAIAQAADGSLRDALTLLDQGIAYSEKNVTLSQINAMLGTVDQHQLLNLLANLNADTANPLLQTIAELQQDGIDFDQALSQLLILLHQLTIAQLAPDQLNEGLSYRETLFQLKSQFSQETLQLLYQILLIARGDLPLAPTPAMGFEMACLRLYTFVPARLQSSNEEPLIATPVPQTYKESNHVKPDQAQPNNQTPEMPSATAAPLPPNDWASMIDQLAIRGLTKALAQHCGLINQTDDVMTLALDPSHQALLNPSQQHELNQALNAYYQRSITLTIELEKPTVLSPAKATEQLRQQDQQKAEQTLANDAGVRMIKEVFNATITPDSVELSQSGDS